MEWTVCLLRYEVWLPDASARRAASDDLCRNAVARKPNPQLDTCCLLGEKAQFFFLPIRVEQLLRSM